MEGLYTSDNTTSTGRLIDMHAAQHGDCLAADTLTQRKTRKCIVGLTKNGSRDTMPEADAWTTRGGS